MPNKYASEASMSTAIYPSPIVMTELRRDECPVFGDAPLAVLSTVLVLNQDGL